MRKRMFSGIQPTGGIHIGNYLAAIRPWTVLQYTYDSIFCIVDLHAVTVQQDPAALKARTRETAGILLAAGIDPVHSAVFVQSHVSAHSEMAWLLACIIPMGWMFRMTQFKEKSFQMKQQVSTGLFVYPALMAADILLHETDLVPVGEDQKQHIELTRDAAKRFNSLYGDLFRLPEAVIPERGARIMALDDPAKKMSKTEGGKGHVISLLDTSGDIREKIMKATTDSLREIRFDENRPGIMNLLTIYELFSGLDRPAIENRFEGKGYGQMKSELADLVIDHLNPLQARYRDFVSDPTRIDRLLQEGAARVRPRAEKVISSVKDRMGLG